MRQRYAAVRSIHAICLPLMLLLTCVISKSESRSGQPVPMESDSSRRRIAQDYGRLPMDFEPNMGQIRSDSQFFSHGTGYRLSLSPTTAEIHFPTASLKMNIRGGDVHATMSGADKLAGEANYFQGPADQWITHVPTYGRVVVDNVYPGIDLTYYGNQNRLEYDFIVKAGASPNAIDVAFEGASKLALADNGDLLITIGDQQLRQAKPTIYQESQGTRLSIKGRYVVRRDNRVGVEVAQYDSGKTLVIDPQLVYTLIGGQSIANAIATDSAGNAYIAGVDPEYAGGCFLSRAAFVQKMNATGTASVYRNHFGSLCNIDVAAAITVDAAGNAYVAGWTDLRDQRSGFPWEFPTVNPIQAAPGGGVDSFVIKFDTAGQMVYSTLLGGSGADKATGVAVDSLGNTYVTGETLSPNFPTARPFQSTLHGNSDAFVTVLNPQGSAFIYSTYIGGSSVDAATGIAVDSSGNAYVTGHTRSSDFPTSRAIRTASAGAQDAFVLRLNAAGSALDYSTYFGGSGDDRGNGITVDSFRNAYVVGTTTSTDFPTVSAFQSTLAGKVDAFVTKIDSTGNAFVYSTYLGGTDDDTTRPTSTTQYVPALNAITVNTTGNAYVAGTTYSRDFPQVRSLQTFPSTTERIAFVSQLSVDGSSLLYSTLLGGSKPERDTGVTYNIATGIAADPNGNVYVAGLTNALDFPLQSRCDCPYVFDEWGGESAFIAKLKDDPPQFTRFEQNSSNIHNTGAWYGNSMAAHSGGSAVLALDTGARATFTFNGTAAKWIGYKDPWSGIANVYLDGALVATVDTYSANGQAQIELYTTPTLTATTHTLAIEVKGTRNPAAQSSWVWVNAFDAMVTGTVSGGGGSTGGGGTTETFTRVEQTNSAVTYTGTWDGNGMSVHSGGSAVLALNAGSRATFTFNGTAAKWIGYKDPWSGIANVYVDGVLKTQVDTYSASSQAQAVLFTTSGLTSGEHTLTIEVAGTKNPSAQSAWIWVDAFESASDATTGGGGSTSGGGSSGGGTTTGTFTRVEQNNSAVTYTGTWYGNAMSIHSGGTAVLALDRGSRATFAFTGSGAKWIGYKDPWSGIANVYVDGVLTAQVDSYSASSQAQSVLFSVTGLSAGSHTIIIEVTNTKNASAQSAWIWVDAFDYAP